MDLFWDNRSHLRFDQKFSFIDQVTISFLTEMGDDVLDTDRVAFRDVCDIRVQDVVTINNNYQAASNRFHFISFCHQDAGVFSQTNADACGIRSDSLCESTKSSPFFEMRIYDHAVDQSEAGRNFDFPFQMRSR